MKTFDKQDGFTLIELLITTAVGLIMMAGMTSVFISQTRTATMLKNKTEAMGDLFLASQIMQSELRGAKEICWTGNALVYQPIDSQVSILPCGAAVTVNGSFTYQQNAAPAADWRIMWKRTNKVRSEELLRGLPPVGGLSVTVITLPPAIPPLPTTYVTNLKSNFTGQGNQAKTLGLTFKVWARNK